MKKIDFAHLVKDAKSFASFSPSCQFQAEQNDIKLTQHGCQEEFLQDRRTSEAKTLVSGKAECLLAIGENEKVIFLECQNNFLEVIHV